MKDSNDGGSRKGGRSRTYKNLLVWHKGIGLVKQVYLVTGTFPFSERFGLVSQMRRAAVSVPSNVAEGQSRRSPADFARFLYISLGSLAELETQLVISVELGYCSASASARVFDVIYELQKMIHSLRSKVAGRQLTS
jgi:four helix bundle protein